MNTTKGSERTKRGKTDYYKMLLFYDLPSGDPPDIPIINIEFQFSKVQIDFIMQHYHLPRIELFRQFCKTFGSIITKTQLNYSMDKTFGKKYIRK